MQIKRQLLVVAGLGLVHLASAQAPLVDRNFQRLDRATSKTSASAQAKAMADNAQKATDLNYWQVAAAATFPDWVQSYSGSILYTDLPNGNIHDDKGNWTPQGLKAFQFTGTFTHWQPKGGGKLDEWTGTATYQVTADGNGAITPGATYSSDNAGFSTTMPFMSGSLNPASDVLIIPTLTFDEVDGGGDTANGFVPDIMVIYTPAPVKGLALSVDATAATIIAGPSLIQVAGKYAFGQNGTTGVKGAVTMTKTSRPVFTALVVIKI